VFEGKQITLCCPKEPNFWPRLVDAPIAPASIAISHR